MQTRTQIEAQLASYRAELERAVGMVNALKGAVQALEWALTTQEKADAVQKQSSNEDDVR